jgi:hypothetical protein
MATCYTLIPLDQHYPQQFAIGFHPAHVIYGLAPDYSRQLLLEASTAQVLLIAHCPALVRGSSFWDLLETSISKYNKKKLDIRNTKS